MGPPSYMRPVVDGNVDMQRIPVFPKRLDSLKYAPCNQRPTHFYLQGLFEIFLVS